MLQFIPTTGFCFGKWWSRIILNPRGFSSGPTTVGSVFTLKLASFFAPAECGVGGRKGVGYGSLSRGKDGGQDGASSRRCKFKLVHSWHSNCHTRRSRRGRTRTAPPPTVGRKEWERRALCPRRVVDTDRTRSKEVEEARTISRPDMAVTQRQEDPSSQVSSTDNAEEISSHFSESLILF